LRTRRADGHALLRRCAQAARVVRVVALAHGASGSAAGGRAPALRATAPDAAGAAAAADDDKAAAAATPEAGGGDGAGAARRRRDACMAWRHLRFPGASYLRTLRHAAAGSGGSSGGGGGGGGGGDSGEASGDLKAALAAAGCVRPRL
jgi:hypothetical protein